MVCVLSLEDENGFPTCSLDEVEPSQSIEHSQDRQESRYDHRPSFSHIGQQGATPEFLVCNMERVFN